MSGALPVYVFGEQPRPVFHAPGGRIRVLDDGATAHTTKCGVALYVWRAGNYRDLATRLRRDWADRIGVPCTKCWPEAS